MTAGHLDDLGADLVGYPLGPVGLMTRFSLQTTE
jgi:hypothetical protein